jgi:Ca2+-transporting ATPase
MARESTAGSEFQDRPDRSFSCPPPETDARALSFAALVATNLDLVLVNRSLGASIFAAFTRPNAALWWVGAVTAAILAGVILFPRGRELYHFGPLHGDDILVALASGLIALLLLELAKKLIEPILAARLGRVPAVTR